REGGNCQHTGDWNQRQTVAAEPGDEVTEGDRKEKATNLADSVEYTHDPTHIFLADVQRYGHDYRLLKCQTGIDQGQKEERRKLLSGQYRRNRAECAKRKARESNATTAPLKSEPFDQRITHKSTTNIATRAEQSRCSREQEISFAETTAFDEECV